MNEAKFTRGPWTNHGCYIYRVGTDGKRTGNAIANTRVDEFVTPEEEEQNARLIAAAPDLYTALQHTTFLLHSACLVLEDEEARKKALDAVQRAMEVMRKADGGQTP